MDLSNLDTLRPLPGALWDTELIPVVELPEAKKVLDALAAKSTYSILPFFTTSRGQPFQRVEDLEKTLSDTNMYQPGQLPQPSCFHAQSFSLRWFDESLPKDEREALRKGVFEFTWKGGRTYCQLPIDEIPETFAGKQNWWGLCASDEARIAAGNKNALLIEPTENFGVRLQWENNLIVSKIVRVRATIWGTHWTAV